jgi:hypothetical protein
MAGDPVNSGIEILSPSNPLTVAGTINLPN